MKNLVKVLVLSLVSTAAFADDPAVNPQPAPQTPPSVTVMSCGPLGFVVSSAKAIKGFLETASGPVSFDGVASDGQRGFFTHVVYTVSTADGKTGTLTVVTQITTCGRGSCRSNGFDETHAQLTLNGEKSDAFSCF